MNDFVLVSFETLKGNFEEYVGQICEIEEEEVTCKKEKVSVYFHSLLMKQLLPGITLLKN